MRLTKRHFVVDFEGHVEGNFKNLVRLIWKNFEN
jgi:hypothetical protein